MWRGAFPQYRNWWLPVVLDYRRIVRFDCEILRLNPLQWARFTTTILTASAADHSARLKRSSLLAPSDCKRGDAGS